MSDDGLNLIVRPESPRVLIGVGSAGIDPWLRIENEAQMPIILKMEHRFSGLVWTEANAELSESRRIRFLAWVVTRQMGIFFLRTPFLRQTAKHLWRVFRWQPFGTSAMRGLMKGNRTFTRPNSHQLRVTHNLPADLCFTGVRTLEALRYYRENFQFDFLLRLTSTCLPVPTKIEELVRELPSVGVYAGEIHTSMGRNFVGGPAVLLSRDVIDGVLAHSRDFPFMLYEDVALGHLIAQHGLAEPREIKRIDFSFDQEIPGEVGCKWPDKPVVRCKAESPTTTESGPVITLMKRAEPYLK